jgi:hypothetical protein
MLHPNVGARLRKEIELLPNDLKNSSFEFENATVRDQSMIILYLLILGRVVVMLLLMQEKKTGKTVKK